jgi:hypothetical protein
LEIEIVGMTPVACCPENILDTVPNLGLVQMDGQQVTGIFEISFKFELQV